MTIQISSQFAFSFERPTSALLQFEVAQTPDQSDIQSETRITDTEKFSRVAADDGVGERIWLRGAGRIEVQYSAQVSPKRQHLELTDCRAIEPHDLPGDAVKYLLDSRYCRADDFQGLVASEFAGTHGGARIEAIRRWIFDNFEYVPGSSDASTNATASFIKRQGICRDYAHVFVTLARASSIPARYVACYAPGVTPQDFHAVAQVFVSSKTNPQTDNQAGGCDGYWQLVDATGMADLSNAAIIGVGRDAADVSFLTTFGPVEFLSSAVDVKSQVTA
ncbi:transglutaminase domain-containing protein [Erythrobacter sp. Alg231-14]|uniref:transglutaminase domain-containing protein n=1 Tax=Erythrobacter sp. Alg231-14 TaxID=1922225 RepID=UPI000D55C2E5